MKLYHAAEIAFWFYAAWLSIKNELCYNSTRNRNMSFYNSSLQKNPNPIASRRQNTAPC